MAIVAVYQSKVCWTKNDLIWTRRVVAALSTAVEVLDKSPAIDWGVASGAGIFRSPEPMIGVRVAMVVTGLSWRRACKNENARLTGCYIGPLRLSILLVNGDL
jgi:hypothetical protein